MRDDNRARMAIQAIQVDGTERIVSSWLVGFSAL